MKDEKFEDFLLTTGVKKIPNASVVIELLRFVWDHQQNKIDRLDSEFDSYIEQNGKEFCDNLTLKEQLRIAKKALDFYASESSHYDSKYEWGEDYHPEMGTDVVLSGERARLALKAVEEV